MTNKPSAAYSTAANTFVKTLVDGGVFQKADIIYVTNAATDNDGEARLNWANPGTYNGVINGKVTFNANKGFSADDKNAYIETGLNPTLASCKYSLNSGTLCFGTYNPAYKIGIQAGIWGRMYFANYSATSFRGNINTNWDSTNYNSPINETSLHTLTRTNETHQRAYYNKTLINNHELSSLALINKSFKIFNVYSDYVPDGIIDFVFIGSGLTEEEVGILSDAWHEFSWWLYDYDENNSYSIAETDDLYAHESQILIKEINGTNYLFEVYTSDKDTATEAQITAKVISRIYNLDTGRLLKRKIIFYPGMAAIVPSNKLTIQARGYFYGNTVRYYLTGKESLFIRELDISDSDYNNWAWNDIAYAKMWMLNSGGELEYLDMIAANYKTHLEQYFGDTYTGYNLCTPWFRNLTPAVSGDNWFSTLQFSDEYTAPSYKAPTFCVKSTDAGNTWTILGAVGYTTVDRVAVIEPAISILSETLHIICRTSSSAISHYTSSDGITWTKQDDLSFVTTLESKPDMINNGNIALIALQIVGKVGELSSPGNRRSTQGIYSTTDFNTFTLIKETRTATFIHYPMMFIHNNKIYMSYTKGIASKSSNGRNDIYLMEIDI